MYQIDKHCGHLRKFKINFGKHKYFKGFSYNDPGKCCG